MKKIGAAVLMTVLMGAIFPLSTLATDNQNQSSETIISTNESSSSELTSETTTKKEIIKDVEVSEAIPKIENDVNQLIGEKKGEDVPVETSPSPSQIRETLLAGNFGMTKEELSKYTDEELEQTMTLFTRYNYDISGMDYGAYARLVRTLFEDKTVNANDALTQLAFNPASFTSFSSMIPEVEKLKVYLDTLYPVTSSFIPGLGLNSSQLVERLTALQQLEDQLTAEGKTLPFGRIAGLVSTNILPVKQTDNSTSSTTTTTTQESGSKSSTKPTDSKKDGSLPKTGEKSDILSFIGVGTLGLFTAIGISLKRKI